MRLVVGVQRHSVPARGETDFGSEVVFAVLVDGETGTLDASWGRRAQAIEAFERVGEDVKKTDGREGDRGGNGGKGDEPIASFIAPFWSYVRAKGLPVSIRKPGGKAVWFSFSSASLKRRRNGGRRREREKSTFDRRLVGRVGAEEVVLQRSDSEERGSRRRQISDGKEGKKRERKRTINPPPT
jgi:hypothetical protein